jgi:molybdate transport system substrate-binding protein
MIRPAIVAQDTTHPRLAQQLTVNYRPPTMSNYRSKLLAAILIIVYGCCLPAHAGKIRVAVAANFAATLAQIGSAFEQQTGHRVILASGSTGKHYAQIINGAPFDAFFAADTVRPELLDEAGIAVPNTRYSYALGRLVLWSPQSGLVDETGKSLSGENFHRLAIANPRLAPYGAAAREVLEKMQLWETLQKKLVRGENINQAFQFVESGNAQLGFVAASQLVGADYAAHGSRWDVPAELHTPIRQQAVLLKDSDVARQFMQFALTPEVGQIIEKNGYDLPQKENEPY